MIAATQIRVGYLILYNGKPHRVANMVHRTPGNLRGFVQAKLVNKIGVLPASRLEEGRDRRLQGQLKRLQRKVDEATQRRADPVDADGQVAAIESLRPAALPSPAKAPEVIDIDLLNWRNDK